MCVTCVARSLCKTVQIHRSIWDYSIFDRKLRLLFPDAIERVEVALRCRLACYYSEQFGPFGYLEHVTCSRLKQKQIDDLVNKMT